MVLQTHRPPALFSPPGTGQSRKDPHLYLSQTPEDDKSQLPLPQARETTHRAQIRGFAPGLSLSPGHGWIQRETGGCACRKERLSQPAAQGQPGPAPAPEAAVALVSPPNPHLAAPSGQSSRAGLSCWVADASSQVYGDGILAWAQRLRSSVRCTPATLV